jgi:butyryl-CoA dehydrogenase
VPKEWGLKGPEAWDLFPTTVVSAFPGNAANCVGMLQGAFDELLAYTGERVVGGKPVRQHVSTAAFLGEMASVISVLRAARLQLAYQYDHGEKYGSRTTDSMIAQARSVLSFVSRRASELILRAHGVYGFPGICP